MDKVLSIVVLSYKNGGMLLETIDSILNQDYPSIEIVICDDASPDFDSSRLKQYIENINVLGITFEYTPEGLSHRT